MNDEELGDAMQKLRAFASAQGMQWVLDEVDQAISLGMPETRTLRQASRGGQTTYEDVTDQLFQLPDASPAARSGRRSEQFIRRRAMTPLEQAQLLIQALRRVLIDLDEVAVGSLDVINGRRRDSVDYDQKFIDEAASTPPLVINVYFVPDEGDSSPAINIDDIVNSERREMTLDILDRIEEEINS